jgi:hypothetical protein
MPTSSAAAELVNKLRSRSAAAGANRRRSHSPGRKPRAGNPGPGIPGQEIPGQELQRRHGRPGLPSVLMARRRRPAVSP